MRRFEIEPAVVLDCPIRHGRRGSCPSCAISRSPPRTRRRWPSSTRRRSISSRSAGRTACSPTACSCRDGTLNMAILKFKTDQLGKGIDYRGHPPFRHPGRGCRGILEEAREPRRRALHRPGPAGPSGRLFRKEILRPRARPVRHRRAWLGRRRAAARGRQAAANPAGDTHRAKLRHLAIACKDPDAMADFYVKAFDFKIVRSNDGAARLRPPSQRRHDRPRDPALQDRPDRPRHGLYRAAPFRHPGRGYRTGRQEGRRRAAASTTWTRPSRSGSAASRSRCTAPRASCSTSPNTPGPAPSRCPSRQAGRRVGPRPDRPASAATGLAQPVCPDRAALYWLSSLPVSEAARCSNATAPPDPGPRSRRPQTVGEAGRGHRRGAARPLRAIRRPGVSPAGAERIGTRFVLRPVRGAGAHRAQRLGVARDPRGDGPLQSAGRVRPADRRARRWRAAMALRPVLYAGAGDRRGALRARTAASGRRDLLGRSARRLCRPAASIAGEDRRQARHLRLHKAAGRVWARDRPGDFGRGETPDAAGDACAGPRPPRNRRPLALSRIRRRQSASTTWIRPRVSPCWTRSTKPPQATNSCTPINGRSAISCCGTTASRCTGARPFDPGARRLMKRMTMRLDRYRHVIPNGRLAQSEVGMPI